MPSSRAFRSLEPAFSPTTTKLVFFDTEPEALPPRSSIFSVASSRVNLLSAPVRTKVFPANRASVTTRLLSKFTPACRSRSTMWMDCSWRNQS